MLLTLELFVFAFGVVVTLVGAILRLLSRLSDIQSNIARLNVEVECIKDVLEKHYCPRGTSRGSN